MISRSGLPEKINILDKLFIAFEIHVKCISNIITLFIYVITLLISFSKTIFSKQFF